MRQTTHKAIRPGGSYVGPGRASRPLSPREKLIGKLTEAQQQVYWCVALAGEEDRGLDVTDLLEMTHLRLTKCQAALWILEQIGVIWRCGPAWRIRSDASQSSTDELIHPR